MNSNSSIKFHQMDSAEFKLLSKSEKEKIRRERENAATDRISSCLLDAGYTEGMKRISKHGALHKAAALLQAKVNLIKGITSTFVDPLRNRELSDQSMTHVASSSNSEEMSKAEQEKLRRDKIQEATEKLRKILEVLEPQLAKEARLEKCEVYEKVADYVEALLPLERQRETVVQTPERSREAPISPQPIPVQFANNPYMFMTPNQPFNWYWPAQTPSSLNSSYATVSSPDSSSSNTTSSSLCGGETYDNEDIEVDVVSIEPRPLWRPYN